MTWGERRKGGERRTGQGAKEGAALAAWRFQERRTRDRRRRDRAGVFVDRRQLPRPQRVMIVDDDADVRAVWREWLTLWRFSVLEAENGSVAVERARERRPDVVIMDVTMPVLDGFGATEQLKRDRTTARVPVLLLSADSTRAAIDRASSVGGDAFLSKPIRAGELLEEIRRAFRRQIAEREEAVRQI